MAQKGSNNAPVSSNAPTDQPISLATTDAGASLKAFDKLIAPAVKQAHKTLPQAKKRFLAGLPPDESFFLTTRIYDTDGKYEQVFVRVAKWGKDKIEGTIASDLNLVEEYKTNQSIEFPEKAILDWTIAKADGREKGNYVGKFIDTLQQ